MSPAYKTFHHRFRVTENSLLVLISLGFVRTRRHKMKSNFCRHQSVPQKLMYVFLVVRRPSLSDDKKPMYYSMEPIDDKKIYIYSSRRQVRIEPYIE